MVIQTHWSPCGAHVIAGSRQSAGGGGRGPQMKSSQSPGPGPDAHPQVSQPRASSARLHGQKIWGQSRWGHSIALPPPPPAPVPVATAPPPPPAPLATTPEAPAVDPWSVPPPGSARSMHAGAAAARIAIAVARVSKGALVGMAAVRTGAPRIVVRSRRRGAVTCARPPAGSGAAAAPSSDRCARRACDRRSHRRPRRVTDRRVFDPALQGLPGRDIGGRSGRHEQRQQKRCQHPITVTRIRGRSRGSCSSPPRRSPIRTRTPPRRASG